MNLVIVVIAIGVPEPPVFDRGGGGEGVTSGERWLAGQQPWRDTGCC